MEEGDEVEVGCSLTLVALYGRTGGLNVLILSSYCIYRII
jgi:hypothetical protein